MAVVGGEIECDAPLSAVGDLEEGVRGTLFAVEGVLQIALGIAGRRFDLDHVGTEIGQDGARPGDEGPGGDLDDPHTVERSCCR